MNKENCALKLVDEIILYDDARSKKHQVVVILSKTSREYLLFRVVVLTVLPGRFKYLFHALKRMRNVL